MPSNQNYYTYSRKKIQKERPRLVTLNITHYLSNLFGLVDFLSRFVFTVIFALSPVAMKGMRGPSIYEK